MRALLVCRSSSLTSIETKVILSVGIVFLDHLIFNLEEKEPNPAQRTIKTLIQISVKRCVLNFISCSNFKLLVR